MSSDASSLGSTLGTLMSVPQNHWVCRDPEVWIMHSSTRVTFQHHRQPPCFSGPPFNCKERVWVYLGLWSHFRILSALGLPVLLATKASKKAGPVQSLSLIQENVDAILPEGVVICGNHNNYGIWLIIMTALSCLGWETLQNLISQRQ